MKLERSILSERQNPKIVQKSYDFIIFFKMNCHQIRVQKDKSTKKSYPLTLTVLNLPSKNLLIPMPSPSIEYQLYHHTRYKINIAAFTIELPRAKLFTNLETYQWRFHTDFPIVKTRYVSVKNHCSSASQKIQISVFNEYCPLRLNRIYQMSTAQAIYLIKECLIGFQRLFNRFGGFQITETMISINQKGYCKVWINQNFSSNYYLKIDSSETKILNKIINIIEHHCIQSKNSKRLFRALNHCQNFLQALKMIDTFILAEKILVPSRFIFLNFITSSKQSKKDLCFDTNKKYLDIFHVSQKNSSLRSPINLIESRKRIMRSQDRKVSQNKSLSPETSDIKHFKSEDKMSKGENQMKISVGETAFSSNIKDNIKSSNFGNVSLKRETINQQKRKDNRSERKKHTKWIQQSLFLVDFSEIKGKKEKQKKELAQSEAMILKSGSTRDRKYSANNFLSQGSDNPFYRCGLPSKKSNHFPNPEISYIISEKQNSSNITPRLILQEEEENKKVQHSEKIIEGNGWRNNARQLLQTSEVLKESFHEAGNSGNVSIERQEVKLEKLDMINKKKMTMSILPEEQSDEIQ